VGLEEEKKALALSLYEERLKMMEKAICLIFLIMGFLFVSSFASFCSDGHFKLISPKEGETIIAKKPPVKARFSLEIVPESLMIILDRTDVTQLIKISENELVYEPFEVLPAGKHRITFFGKTEKGKDVQETYNFSTRHTPLFKEAYSKADLSSLGEACIKVHQEAQSLPGASLDTNMDLEGKAARENIHLDAAASLRYFNQDIPVELPLKKGFDIAGFSSNGEYEKNGSRIKLSLGDVQVSESSLTVDRLFQRGAFSRYSNSSFHFDVFSVTDTYPLDFSKDYTKGLAEEYSFSNNKASLRITAASGKRPPTLWSTAQSGNVFGLLLKIRPLEEKLKIEFENAYTKFDPDTSDEFGKMRDKSFKLKLSGTTERFHYETFYDFIGGDFQSIGNENLPKDKKGGGFNVEMNVEKSNLGLGLARYQDNVKNDSLFPTVVSWDGAFNYSFNGILNVPFGFGYQYNSQKNTSSPSELNQIANSFSIDISYLKDIFQTGFRIDYSLVDDKTEADNDTYITNYFLNLFYAGSKVSLFPFFCLNHTKDKISGITTNSFTTCLDITFPLPKGFNGYAGGSYITASSSDRMIDTQNTDVQLSISHPVPQLFQIMGESSLYLKGEYLKDEDRVAHLSSEDFHIFLGIGVNLTSSF